MWDNSVLSEVTQILDKNADPEVALGMAAYQRNLFPFLGIQSVRRRELTKPFINAAKSSGHVDWSFITELWALDNREYQYVAMDIIHALSKTLTVEDIAHLRALAVQKSWWDTVDILAKPLGDIILRYPERKRDMLAWSTDDNIWLRRLAIIHQLAAKEKTDINLLRQIIVNNLNQTEFFINKAIGWALRQYSKTDSDWVRDFISDHSSGLSTLSVREASKYL
jgi:3-methyladenine DNA glycosylase AlkD